MRQIYKKRLNTLITLLPWFFILYQMEIGLFTPADAQTSRSFSVAMILISSLGSGLSIRPISKKLITILSSLMIQIAGFLIVTSVGLLDVGYSGNLMLLDAMGGFSAAIAGLSGIAKLILKIIPIPVVIAGLIGMWQSDSPDESQSVAIDFAYSLALLATFFGVGALVGFI